MSCVPLSCNAHDPENTAKWGDQVVIKKSGKTSLKSQKEEEHFCKQVIERRKMRNDFDNSLGKVRYVHVEREKLTQMVTYLKNFTVYYTLEPEMTIENKLKIMNKIKKMTSHL